MLPPDRRLRRSDEFATTVRRGRRCGQGSLVVHLLAGDEPAPGRVGFVVSKSVGGSVVRHATVRRLRAQVHQRLERIPDGALVVVRALPSAATAASDELGRELDAALDRLLVVA